MVVWIKGPSWTVHITEEARPRKRVVSGEAPGTAASGAPQRGAPIGYFFPVPGLPVNWTDYCLMIHESFLPG